MSDIFSKIIDRDRLISILYDTLLESNSLDLYIINCIRNYLNEYALFYSIDTEQLIKSYNEFIATYITDIESFIKTKKLPYEISGTVAQIDRMDYDIVLIISVLLSSHRYSIMNHLHSSCIKTDNALFIGIGPGLELELLKDRCNQVTAYDKHVSEFCRAYHKDVIFEEREFVASDDRKFDAVFMIELLEHINNPYQFIDQLALSINEKGLLYLTTATNIPQFDHLVNFPEDHIEFEERVANAGFGVKYKQKIEHNYLLYNIDASNTYYILEKLR